MYKIVRAFCFLWLLAFSLETKGQRINGEIFIPMGERSEIRMKPDLDTLENKKTYEFKLRVSSEFKISQILLEKGLAIQNDSVLTITPNSTKYGQIDTATLRVIVSSISGKRVYLFQRQFFIKVPEKIYPMISNPKMNIIMLNDKIELERNRPYPKNLFTDIQPKLTMFDQQVNMNEMQIKSVTVAMYDKEGKQYVSAGDTITMEAVREIKKIKNPVPVYIKVDAQKGNTKKSIWSRIILYAD
jgi:hypothetical protein